MPRKSPTMFFRNQNNAGMGMNLKWFKLCACSLLLLALCPVLIAAQQAPIVKKIEIRHIGPPAASEALILANIRVREGDTYSRTSVDDDVSTLWKTGYFYNIRVAEEPLDDGIKLIYMLQGNPTLTQIVFTGNKRFSSAKLQKTISSKIGEPLNERKLFNDTQEILKLYQKKGLQKTQVKYVPVIDEKLGKGTVTFQITESPKIKIKEVRFIGADSFKESKLRRVIKTRRRWMFSWLTGSGILKEEQFEEDKEKLAEFYRNEGFMDFEIKEVKFDQVDPHWMVIQFVVYEGARYRVGSVEFQGNTLFTSDEIMTRTVVREGSRVRRGLMLTPGAVFTPKGLAADREGIEDLYGAKGYIDVRVDISRIPNTERNSIDLVYRITEGRQSYIEKIEIKGNTKTRDKVIRRELAVNPGEVFDMVRVKLSTNRLYGLNYFSKVDAQPEPTDVRDTQREAKNLVIGVEEKNTGNVRLGAGFSSVDELVGFVEVTQGNFDLFKPPYFLGTGGGQKIRLRAQVGTVRQDYQITFIEPWFLNRKLALGVDLYHRDLRYYSDLYDVQLSGARVSLTRALWNEFWQGTVAYAIENVGIVNMPDPTTVIGSDGRPVTIDPVPPELRAEEGYTLSSKVITSLAYDTRNNVFLPTRGQRTSFEVQVAGGPLGGDTDFYKLSLTSSRYIRGFAPGHVLELKGRIGVVDNYGSDDTVHLFDRFFLGGLYSLRGYRYRSVGPRDSQGIEPIGGRTYWYGSAEYSIPIIERLRLAAFYDVGNVYPEAYSFSTQGPEYGTYSDNWGVGVRLNIPMLGPLRLDYAIPITHDRFTSSSGRFQFGVGLFRED
ncbi:MAG: outer membrane protein assembly factor BamA [Verrucomicrobia bacterium]|nr:outer membrane protein assembly factor BamA [Verrucomicrobiota bacterium]